MKHLLTIVCLLLCLPPIPAQGLQPLEDFIASAKKHNWDIAIAESSRQNTESQILLGLGKLLPGISVKGSYTRNQVQAQFQLSPQTPLVTVQRHNQYDLYSTVNATLFDLANFLRVDAAQQASLGASLQKEATILAVTSQITQDYYQVLADLAVLETAQKALEVAKESFRTTAQRFDAGHTTRLDLNRAEAEVERNVQQVATAEFNLAIASRALQSDSRLPPQTQENETVTIHDDLHPEEDLHTFTSKEHKLPQVQSALYTYKALQKLAWSQKLTLIPTITGSFSEHYSNVTGFTGRKDNYQGLINLNWSLDLTTYANFKSSNAQALSAAASLEKTKLQCQDSIYRAWRLVQAGILKSRSARAQEKVSIEAAEIAQSRYNVGASTQLDVLSARRDAFAASVSRIQADADLVNARIQLRIAAGQPFQANVQE